MKKSSILTFCIAVAAAIGFPLTAKAEDACYLSMGRRYVDLTGICEGARAENSSIYDSTIFHIPQGESNLVVYELDRAWTWQNNRWQEEQALSGKIGNLGSAAAHNVSLTLRAGKLDENGEVVQTEIREIVITEVPSRMVANFEAEFSFVPDFAVVESLNWY